MEKWYERPGTPGSNVVYSRIRLVRNWKEYPFPGKMTKEQSAEMTGRLFESLSGIGALEEREFRFAHTDRMAELEKTALWERRALHRSVLKKREAAGLVLSEDEETGIILNGDDHVRLQLIGTGLSLNELYRRADRLDDYIGDRIDYSFDEKYGYLTSFPTNVGTGLRASAVVHLPLLSKQKNFNSLVSDMSRFGTVIKGVYGDGAENFGSFYRVSNQKTLGQSEKEIVDLVMKSAAELDVQESRLRKEALAKRPLARADEAYKSYGVLRYARRLTRRDAMEFVSQLMWGINDGILKTEKPCSVYGLILGIQPANLLIRAEKPLDKEELDAARAAFLRERLPEIK